LYGPLVACLWSCNPKKARHPHGSKLNHREDCMKRTSLAASAAIALVWATQANAQASELTLCWAAWDPANALVELSKDFEAQSGTKMNFEFVPWPNFADRMLNELNSGGQLCDLMIGD